MENTKFYTEFKEAAFSDDVELTLADFDHPQKEFLEYIKFSDSEYETYVDTDLYQRSSWILWESLWRPLVENHVDFIFIPEEADDWSDILMPLEGISFHSSRDFWIKNKEQNFEVDGDVLAYFRKITGIKFICTTKGVYTIKRHVWKKPSAILTPWEEVDLSIKVDENGMELFLDDKQIATLVKPNYQKIDIIDPSELSKEEELKLYTNVEAKVNAILTELPDKVLSLT